MTSLEERLRDELGRATDDVPGGPDLQASIRTGRRRRRTTRAGLALAVAGVVGIAGLGVTLRGGDDVTTPVATDPATTGFVPGTDIDESLAATIAERLPDLGEPDDVYPSDSEHAGPMPDADFAAAQEWQATYTTQDGQFLVIVSATTPLQCPDCEHQEVPGGTLSHQQYDSDGQTWYGTWLERPDGFVVGALEATAVGGRRSIDPGAVDALVQDPRLAF